MDGLEAVELKLSEVLEDNEKFRFDSEFVNKSCLNVKKILLNKQYEYLSKLNSFNARYKQPIYDENSNIKVLNSQYIRDYFLDYESAKNGYGALVPKEAIMINSTGVGTLGRVNINYLNEKISVDNHVNIIVAKNINSYYLTIFLKSYYGQSQISRYYSGSSGQIEIYPKDFNSFIIPIFSNTFQTKIETLVKSSYQKLELSKTLYKEAEQLLLKELDLDCFTPSSDNIAIKTLSESFGMSGRLDSEYYQPKYDEIEKLISDRGNFTYIKNEFNHVKTSFDKSKDGYNYIEIGNVNVADGTNIFNYVETEDLPANAKINVKNGDLLVSTVRPYRGAITIINTSEDDLIVSGAFTVLRKKDISNINIQVLQVLLRTNIYKELLLKYNVGTQYPVIKDEDVLNLIIPIIAQSIQTQIEEKIKQSFELKEASKKLLDLAKRVVEVAIEKNESEAMELLK